jgi:serine/threonine protein kinase
LCDFGYAKSVEHSSARTLVGSEKYIAPEIQKQMQDLTRSNAYSSAVDIWSLGVLIFQFIKKLPLDKLPDFQDKISKDDNFVKTQLWKEVIAQGSIFSKLSLVCILCLRLDPNDRPTAEDIENLLKEK